MLVHYLDITLSDYYFLWCHYNAPFPYSTRRLIAKSDLICKLTKQYYFSVDLTVAIANIDLHTGHTRQH